MRAVVQRVKRAQVDVEGACVGQINQGYLIFLGIGQKDDEEQIERLWNKILKLRIFEDNQGKANLSLQDINGEALIVSQFTLYANCKRGNRPSFTEAGNPTEANRLYEAFVKRAQQDINQIETGVFGAMMDISLVNDGPFTICLDTDTL